MDRPLNRLLPLIALLVVAGVWTWWALDAGAYFGVVFYPGAVDPDRDARSRCSSDAPWQGRAARRAPRRARRAGPDRPAHRRLDHLEPGARRRALGRERVALYAVAFALGLWICHLLGRRMGARAAAARDRGRRSPALATLISAITTDDAFPLRRARRPRAAGRLSQRQRRVLRDRVLRRARNGDRPRPRLAAARDDGRDGDPVRGPRGPQPEPRLGARGRRRRRSSS